MLLLLFYIQIGNKISALKPAIALYASFTRCIVSAEQAQVCIPLVRFIADNGNTTLYEWSYGEAPLSVQPDAIMIELDVEDDRNGEVVLYLFYEYNIMTRLNLLIHSL